MYNYLKPDNREEFTNPYSDINSLTTHYSKEILSLTNLGIFTGDEHGNFRPKDTLTRAEMASVLTKAFQLKATGAFTFKDIPNGYWAKMQFMLFIPTISRKAQVTITIVLI